MLVVSTVGDGEPKCLKLEQDGGWLVLYDAAGIELWKRGPGGARLEVQDNGHVVLYPAQGKAVWATNWLLIRGKPERHTGPASGAAPADLPMSKRTEAERPSTGDQEAAPKLSPPSDQQHPDSPGNATIC